MRQIRTVSAFLSSFSFAPGLLGITLGFSVGVGFLPGGYDAFYNFLRLPFPATTAPGWVYLLTAPFGALGWPLRWQAWTLFTIIVTALALASYGNRNWWVALLGVPMLYNLWLGNLEVFAIAGTALGMLVVNKKIHPAWWGVGILALATKPQVGYGMIAILTWWMIREQNWRRLIWGLVVAVGLVGLSELLWPGWIIRWLDTILSINIDWHSKSALPLVFNNWWNGSIFPYGLLSWPIALLVPAGTDRLRRLRMVTAATTLSSPYLAMYHLCTLMTLTNRSWALILSWLIVGAGLLLTQNWMSLSWILPAALLLFDVFEVLKRRHVDKVQLTKAQTL